MHIIQHQLGTSINFLKLQDRHFKVRLIDESVSGSRIKALIPQLQRALDSYSVNFSVFSIQESRRPYLDEKSINLPYINDVAAELIDLVWAPLVFTDRSRLLDQLVSDTSGICADDDSLPYAHTIMNSARQIFLPVLVKSYYSLKYN
jgi:hypothetical protein